VITLSCDIKISEVYSFVSSQSTRVTDRRTDGRTDRQNYHPQDRASIAASRGKNGNHPKSVIPFIILLDSRHTCGLYADTDADPRQCTPSTPGVCHGKATCTQVTPYWCACNPASSYRCRCNQGYIGDGLNCTREFITISQYYY